MGTDQPSITYYFIFMDIEGFSKRSAPEQARQLTALNTIIAGWIEGRKPPKEPFFINTTGDGMVIGFEKSRRQPYDLAVHIQKSLNMKKKSDPANSFKVRIGLNSGDVIQMKNVNGVEDFFGNGINMAQRIMNFGDGGHILASQHMSEELMKSYDAVSKTFHRLAGTYETKHDKEITLYNIYGNDFGNRNPPPRRRISQRHMEQVIDEGCKLSKRGGNLGLMNVWKERQELRESDWIEFLKSACAHIDILSTVYSQFMSTPDVFFNALKERIDDDCQVRIIILDAQSEVAKSIEKEGREHLTRDIMDSIRKIAKKEFLKESVRLYNKTDVCSITRIDDIMRVTHYIPLLHDQWSGDNSPTLEIRRTDKGLFGPYLQYFENLWNDEDTKTLSDWIQKGGLDANQ